MAFWGVIPAAGIGSRMGGDRPKQYLSLQGRTVLDHAVSRLVSHPSIQKVAVAISKHDAYWADSEFYNSDAVITVVGGAERVDSVLSACRALLEIADPQDWVMVHDAARPCLRAKDLNRLISALENGADGAILAVPMKDTVKRSTEQKRISETVDRSLLWRAFTPQVFRLGPLIDAIESGLSAGIVLTDEASAMEHAGVFAELVAGEEDNIKITTPADLALAQFYLDQKENA